MHSVRNRSVSIVLILILASSIPAIFVGSASAQSTTTTGVSRDFNPAISINALLIGRLADTTTDRSYNGIDLQESEIQFTSIVDPFWKANLIFAVHPEHGHAEEEADEHAHGYVGDVEVATVAGQAIPWGLGLVLGKD